MLSFVFGPASARTIFATCTMARALLFAFCCASGCRPQLLDVDASTLRPCWYRKYNLRPTTNELACNASDVRCAQIGFTLLLVADFNGSTWDQRELMGFNFIKHTSSSPLSLRTRAC